ncbi:MAG TPA: hypothetical protein PLD48_04645 [Bacillota bacterium]|nr:hypothetical protein [Bacillota bacterium]
MNDAMYSRDFGSIRSDGQLREFESNWQKQYSENLKQPETYKQPEEPRSDTIFVPLQQPQEKAEPTMAHHDYDRPAEKKSLFNLDFLKNIQVDDLILIGIGILLLLDSDASNDMLIILILLMLFF